MAKYVKGNAVANATSYELFEKVNGTYTSLKEASEINFEVSALGLAAGDHVLVVKAKADGYEDSEYSNEVTYKVDESGSGSGSGDSGTTNLLTLGTLSEHTVTSSTSSTELTASDVYFTYTDIPVSANTTYISKSGRRTFYLDSSKNPIGAAVNIYNLNPQFVFTTPANCAYVIISYKYEDIAVADAALSLYTA